MMYKIGDKVKVKSDIYENFYVPTVVIAVKDMFGKQHIKLNGGYKFIPFDNPYISPDNNTRKD